MKNVFAIHKTPISLSGNYFTYFCVWVRSVRRLKNWLSIIRKDRPYNHLENGIKNYLFTTGSCVAGPDPSNLSQIATGSRIYSLSLKDTC